MAAFWRRFGGVLASFWRRFGGVLASFWHRFGIVLASLDPTLDTKTTPKRNQNAPKTPPTPSHFHCFLWEKHTIRARGESNRLPPGSDPPTSRGPNHYANPAPETRLLRGFLCTGNAGPGRAVRVNCRPSRKTLLFKVFDA